MTRRKDWRKAIERLLREACVEEWPTTDEVAERLGVTAIAVRKMLRSERLAGIAVAGRWRIDPASLDRFEAERERLDGPKTTRWVRRKEASR